jgi:hypothetical protein
MLSLQDLSDKNMSMSDIYRDADYKFFGATGNLNTN